MQSSARRFFFAMHLYPSVPLALMSMSKVAESIVSKTMKAFQSTQRSSREFKMGEKKKCHIFSKRGLFLKSKLGRKTGRLNILWLLFIPPGGPPSHCNVWETEGMRERGGVGVAGGRSRLKNRKLMCGEGLKY